MSPYNEKAFGLAVQNCVRCSQKKLPFLSWKTGGISISFFCRGVPFFTKERYFFMSRISSKTLRLVYCAAMIAIATVLGIFSPYLGPQIKLSLAPIAVMFAGAILGPAAGGITGFLSNFISFFVNPFNPGGAFNPGVAVTMALYGVAAGLLFYQKPQPSFGKVALWIFLIQTVFSVFLNTFWLSLFLGAPYLEFLISRLPASYVCCAVYILVLYVLLRNKDKIYRPLRTA